MAPRPTPFDLVFDPLADERFPIIRAALAADGTDPRDRDAFLLMRDVVQLVHDLRPDEGLGEGIDQLTALVHHAYLLWDAGTLTLTIGAGRAAVLLDPTVPPGAPASAADAAMPAAYYAQLPERRIWAQLAPEQPHEPLDGCFVAATPNPDSIRVLGVFGLHPERMGFSVAESTGVRPIALVRADATPLFAPVLPGGAAAGLFSLTGEEELLELGWRIREVAREAGTAPLPGDIRFDGAE